MLVLSTRSDNPSQICAIQRFVVPYDAKYIYFDYNIVESVNADRQSSGEFGGYGNIVYAGIKPDGITEWDYIWEDSSAYIDESMVALPKDVTIHGNNTVNAYDNTYGNVYMSGWRIGCIDVSAYAGQVIEFNINISNYAYEDINLSKLLIDNVRLSSVDMENDSSVNVQYQVVSSENLPENIRGLGIDAEGTSHVLYTSIFEDKPEDGGAPGYQASYARLNLMYRHRYEDISQVGFYLIETEDDFYNTWRDMPENPNTDKIDEVVIITHGKYYALVINADAKENLTVSPDGRVGSDDDALRISDLPRRNIETIRINGCNTGLLNAINVDFEKKEGFIVTGNVAQAFLNNQNVYEVYAWDGNTNPGTISGGDRLSHTQGGFHDALDDQCLKDAQVLYVERDIWFDRTDDDGWWFRDKPMGLVRYINENGQQYCTYEFEVITIE